VRAWSSLGYIPGPPESGPNLGGVPGRIGPRHKQGSGADMCPGLSLRSPLGRKPAAAAWLVARNISQRSEPHERPMRLCSLCIYCGEDAPPATMLTGDAPSQLLMCPVQSASKRCQGHPPNGAPDRSVGKQCARAKRRTVPITPSTRRFPCTPRIRRSRAAGHKKITPATNIGDPKRYILYVPRPTCQGPAPLCMPPFNYKRGGMRYYTRGRTR
jgi:hypothetical protein